MNNSDKGFHGLGIAPGILNVLAKLKLTAPTPIQEQAIPPAIEGKDVIGVAQTGTGKTFAFGIPLIQRVLRDGKPGLIIVPTRELAAQVDEALYKIGASLGIKTAALVGGEQIYRQISRLSRNPQVIIGTPGRIIDHMERKTIDLRRIGILVLDEADRMLDMGFAPQLNKILAALPKEKQTMLFSATIPEQIVTIAKNHLKLPTRIEIARSGSTAQNVTQELFFVPQEDKMRLLEKILQDYRGSVLVFARTKFGAKKISSAVRALGHTSADIHSNKTLSQRRDALNGFKTGRFRVLVATDIAARGIDVTNIELVVNYDLPDNAEDYVHRIGRTGRAGGIGHAISFARPNQRRDVLTIEHLIRATLPVSKLPELPPPAALPKFHVEEKREYRPPRRPSRTSGGRSFGERGGSAHRPPRRPRYDSGRPPRKFSR
ncbi:MAG: DEAD/DEAH box helicase [Patescibacteria group bacterium]|nr:DEAD/DEAH box helicase [Patescibacteria group bacterium]